MFTFALLLVSSHEVRRAEAMRAMPMKSLLLAQLDGKQVVGHSASTATGTGAFVLDPARHTVTYDLTYQGLESGGARSIALHNFGAGKTGDVIKVLCEAGTQPCPGPNSATISGTFDRVDKGALDNNLVGEFDSERIYVEIVGGDGKPEIRGQLAPNTAMAPFSNYVARLEPMAGTGGSGTGTAILSEVRLPGGTISVFYAATVAGTSGAPTDAALVGVSATPKPQTEAFLKTMKLPGLKLRTGRRGVPGGSLSGLYRGVVAKPQAPPPMKLLSAGEGRLAIIVTTHRFPRGELSGVFEPVQ